MEAKVDELSGDGCDPDDDDGWVFGGEWVYQPQPSYEEWPPVEGGHFNDGMW